MTADWLCLWGYLLSIAGTLVAVAAWMGVILGGAVVIDDITGKWQLASAWFVACVLISLACIVGYTEGCIIIGGR